MPRHLGACSARPPWLFSPGPPRPADDPPAARRHAAQEFHVRAQERTGVLVPLYVYPANIHTNPMYNRLIDLKRRYETGARCGSSSIPASGPGKAGRRELHEGDRPAPGGRVRGARGMSPPATASGPPADVRADIDAWLQLYPEASRGSSSTR